VSVDKLGNGSSYGVFNMYGGSISENSANNNASGVYWAAGEINLKGSPQIGSDDDKNAVYRAAVGLVIKIADELDNAYINVNDRADDRARPQAQSNLTVIARKFENASHEDTEFFHYLGTGNRSSWFVVARDDGKDPDLVLGPYVPPPRFGFVSVPDGVHFGERPLSTWNSVGLNGDAPGASHVKKDFENAADNWQYGFEVTNNMHDKWTIWLQTTPFTDENGTVGAIPIAAGKDKIFDLTLGPVKVFTGNTKGESIKWHWTQLDYAIEAQTSLSTVAVGEYKSVFTWNLENAP